MGQCYSVDLRIKLEKSTKSNMQKLLRQWMRDEESDTDGHIGVCWGLDELKKAGIRPSSLDGICKILLAFQQGNGSHVTDDEGFDVYSSGFDARYGWRLVMTEAFFRMSWALACGSYLWISHDEGVDEYEIKADEVGNAEVWEHHSPPLHRR